MAYTATHKHASISARKVRPLATMIRGAISALREGFHWDRGTILNILV